MYVFVVRLGNYSPSLEANSCLSRQ